MKQDFTTLLVVDREHADQLRITWPTWRKFKPELFERPMVLICDELVENRHIDFIDHPVTKLFTIGRPHIDDRTRMLGCFLHLPNEIYTPWYLKLDVDVVATNSDRGWIKPGWFESDAVAVASPWSYTKPASLISALGDWSNGNIKFVREHPPKGSRLDGDKVRHSRFTSWMMFGQTTFTRKVAALCEPMTMPIPSQDTFLWYCIERLGRRWIPHGFKHHGWAHRIPRNLKKLADEVMK